jgi:hypothetical protein
MKTSSLRKLPIFGPNTKSRGSTTIAHRDRQNAGKFPSHGIPYFVLVDSSGNVFFSREGFDENDLRAALASVTSSTIHATSTTP